jgi:peptidyl-prolyl cis-trans isomerase SurA
MRNCISITLAAACASLLLTSPVRAQTLDLSDTGVLIDGIAAVVNDGIVLLSELDTQTVMIVQRLNADSTPLPPMDILRQQILENLVINEIQLQRAQRAGIVVSDEMLNRALADVAARNGTTLGELPGLLAQDGVDYLSYRNQLREQLTIERLRQRDVFSRISVTPRELEDYLELEANTAHLYQRYKVSNILISLPAAASQEQIDEAAAKAQDIYREATSGANFAELAVAYSNAQNALEGGSLGWREGDSLPTLFAEIVPNMQPGQVAPPIRTPSGFHLVRLDEVEGTKPVIEKQTRARHILVKTDEIIDDAIARQKLLEIREEIVDGGDFAAIAKAVSEDPGSAIEGGDLGWAGPGMFVPEFEATMNALEIDQISEPFKSPFGWHIMQVLERRVHDTTEDVRRQNAMMAIRESKVEEETELWIRQIRDEAFVEYRI